jgi:hypothetical protein
MLLAGKVRVWKQWANFHHGLGVAWAWHHHLGLGVLLEKLPGPSGFKHYPGLHPLISGLNEPNRAAKWVGLRFCPKATLECQKV